MPPLKIMKPCPNGDPVCKCSPKLLNQVYPKDKKTKAKIKTNINKSSF
jgi:hypothetical protein